LAGESGCGKTTSALTLLGYRHPNCRIRSGQVRFSGHNLLEISEKQLQRLRGAKIGFVPQNPSTALSPNMKVGQQISEVLITHQVLGDRIKARERSIELLAMVHIPDPEKAILKYPHQFSGGQQQRIIIAIALACNPTLIVLDEPTTSLDVTTQSQILDLLLRLRTEHGMAMLYVTHNLGVMASITDRVGVMYAGEMVENAPIDKLFYEPHHPYTRGLIASVPKITAPTLTRSVILRGLLERHKLPPGCRFAPRCDYVEESCFTNHQDMIEVGANHQVACHLWRKVQRSVSHERHQIQRDKREEKPAKGNGDKNLISVSDLDCAYVFKRTGLLPIDRKPETVVRNVTFNVTPKETFALVGESGSGKSTVARAISGLLVPTQGQILFNGLDISTEVKQRQQGVRREIQIIFQNPAASLNPRRRVRQIIGRPLEVFFNLSGKDLYERVIDLLGDVNLEPTYAMRFPDQLSGGEQQRVAIARALAAEPRLMLCDEILSALDVSVQSNVIDLLRKLQIDRGMAYLFISHDLAVVRTISHRVGVMYQGELWETGKVEEVFGPPYQPYTETLLNAVPEADPDWTPKQTLGLLYEAADVHVGQGCPFAARCTWRISNLCYKVAPEWRQRTATHFVRCHVPFEELLDKQMYHGRSEAEELLNAS
jgi:peptide/nickel transport system ATP-binding protein